jgi:hypothetical protein
VVSQKCPQPLCCTSQAYKHSTDMQTQCAVSDNTELFNNLLVVTQAWVPMDLSQHLSSAHGGLIVCFHPGWGPHGTPNWVLLRIVGRHHHEQLLLRRKPPDPRPSLQRQPCMSCHHCHGYVCIVILLVGLSYGCCPLCVCASLPP